MEDFAKRASQPNKAFDDTLQAAVNAANEATKDIDKDRVNTEAAIKHDLDDLTDAYVQLMNAGRPHKPLGRQLLPIEPMGNGKYTAYYELSNGHRFVYIVDKDGNDTGEVSPY